MTLSCGEGWIEKANTVLLSVPTLAQCELCRCLSCSSAEEFAGYPAFVGRLIYFKLLPHGLAKCEIFRIIILSIWETVRVYLCISLRVNLEYLLNMMFILDSAQGPFIFLLPSVLIFLQLYMWYNLYHTHIYICVCIKGTHIWDV
jgi:hypothetical protein